jgi:hypothetical protein
LCANLEKSIASAATDNLKTMHLAELTNVLAAVPELTKAAEAEAKADKLTTKPEKALIKIAPKLAAISATVPASRPKRRSATKPNSWSPRSKGCWSISTRSIARTVAAAALRAWSAIFAATARDRAS